MKIKKNRLKAKSNYVNLASAQMEVKSFGDIDIPEKLSPK